MVPDQPMLPDLDGAAGSPWCQRWTERHSTWRHLHDGGFDAARYRVERVPDAVAASYVRRHHYSGQPVAALQSYGLLEGTAKHLVGVAVLSVPVSRAVLAHAFPTLEPYRESADLGRLVLADAVPANGESWLLAQVFRQAYLTGLRGIVSFADPVPRRTLTGELILPGHIGACYQALANSLYTGRGTPRTLLLMPDGTVLNDRAVQKIRTQEPGHRYAEARLIAAGAHPRRADQDPNTWLAHALLAAGVRRLRHHGPHRYCFPLGRSRERDRLPLGYPVVDPRPKRPDTDPRAP